MICVKHKLTIWIFWMVLLSGCSGQSTNSQRYEIEVESKPKLDFVIPIADGDVISKPIDIAPDILIGGPAESVSYRIDGELVLSATSSPFNYVLDPDKFPIGNHLLTVTIENSTSQTKQVTVDFSIRQDLPQVQPKSDLQTSATLTPFDSLPTRTVIPTTTPPQSTATKVRDSCPGAEPQRVEVSDHVEVCTKADNVVVRADPRYNGAEYFRIPPGSEVTILDGPRCSDKSSWWYVRVPAGTWYAKGSYKLVGTLNSDQEGWIREGSDEVDRYYICRLP